ncbi:molecular chaperone TorD family protein [Robertmurraya massiliosenegalensis]|uniref:TorD/DmsD family molecular chaperone n=1 Tax=Robertmurraya TaxID=2837507 RepID=UPI0039A59156
MIVQEQHTLVNNYFHLRSSAYDLLRRFFLEEPNRQLLRSLQGGYIGSFPFKQENALIQDGVTDISIFLAQHDMDDVFDSLHWDYTKMFIGPYELPAPLWESAYLNEERLLFQKETLMVRQAYLKYCFLPAQFGKEADDHLGYELDFLYQLNELTMKKIEEEEFPTEMIIDQIRFIEEHLLKWVPILREKIVQHAQFDFYKGMVKILQGFLEIDKVCLEELVTIKN